MVDRDGDFVAWVMAKRREVAIAKAGSGRPLVIHGPWPLTGEDEDR